MARLDAIDREHIKKLRKLAERVENISYELSDFKSRETRVDFLLDKVEKTLEESVSNLRDAAWELKMSIQSNFAKEGN